MGTDEVEVTSSTSTNISLGEPRKVILYNDNNHTMEEVINQIIAAIKCSEGRAKSIMLEAHSKGRAVVIAAHLERCEYVASVLEDIGLRVSIE